MKGTDGQRLLLFEDLLHFVLVDHHDFVGVFARFGVFNAFHHFHVITTRARVGGTLGNLCVFRDFSHC